MLKKIVLFIYLLFLFSEVISQESIKIKETYTYFNQKLPDSIPEIFAPDIISKEYAEFGITISNDFTELYFTRRGELPNPRLGKIMFVKINDFFFPFT